MWQIYLNCHQRMGTLPLKKRVNLDKCSFAKNAVSWQMQFRDKTAYVWGVCYWWDPSLSMSPAHRNAHFMPPWIQVKYEYKNRWSPLQRLNAHVLIEQPRGSADGPCQPTGSYIGCTICSTVVIATRNTNERKMRLLQKKLNCIIYFG